MPQIHYDSIFNKPYKNFVKNNLPNKQKVTKAILLFGENPKHPSLHIEKLSGSNIWTIRINKNDRLFFVWSDEKNTAIFFDIGKHDLYRKY